MHPNDQRNGALTGLQLAHASGLMEVLMLVQWWLIFLGLRVTWKVLGLAWRAARWTALSLFTAAGRRS